mgnify:CR=1 FL=1
MAIYADEIYIPKNTNISNPEKKAFYVSLGTLDVVEIRFKGRFGGLVGVRIYDRGNQIIPQMSGKWLVSDRETVIINEYSRKLDGPPYIINVEAYNLDDTFNHTPELRFILVEKTLQQSIEDLISEIRTLIKKLGR